MGGPKSLAILALVYVLGSFSGCSLLVQTKPQHSTTEFQQRCVSPLARDAAKTTQHAPRTESTPRSKTVPSRFTSDALRVADVIQAGPLLERIDELARKGNRLSLDMLMTRQALTDRILLALLEVASTTAEIVCERDKTDQLADHLDEVDGMAVKNLTVLSLVIGGLAAIVSGGVSLAGGATLAGDAANIGGGFLASTFGVSALFTHSEVDFAHERNLLREVWTDSPHSSNLSPLIWRYLHRSENGNGHDPRAQVLTDWRQKGRLGEEGTADEQRREGLFFGGGGRYSASDLRARASMFETLESSLRLLHEELAVLIQEIAQGPMASGPQKP